jgi:hypothetical protein
MGFWTNGNADKHQCNDKCWGNKTGAERRAEREAKRRDRKRGR